MVKLMTWNARSLSFVEMASVRYIMSDMKVDVMGVSEIGGMEQLVCSRH